MSLSQVWAMVLLVAMLTTLPVWADDCTHTDTASCQQSDEGLSLLQKKAHKLTSEVKVEPECIFQRAGDLGGPFLKCCSAANLKARITCAIDIAATVCDHKYPNDLQFQKNQCARAMVRNVVEPPDSTYRLPVSLKEIIETIDEEEVGFINIIRHGEKCVAKGAAYNISLAHQNLTTVGADRSKYLTRCMTKDAPSVAFPFGKPTAVMCHDVNICGPHGAETIAPLAAALNITVGTSPYDPEGGQNITLQEAWRLQNSNLPSELVPACGIPLSHATYASLTPAEILAHDNAQLDCVIDHARTFLTNRGTVIYQIVYQTAPEVLSRMAIPNLPKTYNHWPLTCPNPKWAEPACEALDVNLWHGWNDTEFPYIPVSTCFDVIWQIKHTRPNRVSEWKAQSIKTLYEGFAGDPDAPCAEDLKAI